MGAPNIILMVADDLGWMDLGCYGSTFYETPCLDQMARDGVRFTQAYAAAPVCSPSRASLLTGQYPARVGVTHYLGATTERGRLIGAPYVDHLPLEETTIAAALQQSGYQTWHVGKWHLGDRRYYPDAHGFMENVGGCDWGHPHQGYFSPYGIETLADGPEGEYLTDRLTDEAIGLIKRRRMSGDHRPFFLYLAHYAVHTPIEAPADLVDKYRRKAKQLGLDQLPALEPGEAFPTEQKQGQRVMRRIVQSDVHYAAMVENLDANLGRLLGALEHEEEADNTIVIFTSDNGGLATAEGSPTCNRPLSEGKGWMYDGGLREPLLVKWPGVTVPGTTCDQPVTSPDFYPTLLAMAELPLRPEQHRDGQSFVPALYGQSVERGPIFWHFPHYGNQGGTPASAIRLGDFKLIEFYEDGRLELYNLHHDIGEETNLVTQLPALAQALQGRLAAWRLEMNALSPTRNARWQGPPKETGGNRSMT